MLRRSFLSMIGAASAAPLVPGGIAAKAAPAAVNPMTYGYAVFWARHGGQFGATQLAKALHIPVANAEAMVGEMLKDRVVRASAHGVKATVTHGGRTALSRSGARTKANSNAPLYWRFKRVGLRARALHWQLHHSQFPRAVGSQPRHGVV